MTDVFNYLPDDKPNGSFEVRMREVQFGDGYKQISEDGLNALSQKWPLSFDRDQDTIALIEDFLIANKGKWFYWTPPGSNAVQKKFICNSWSKQPYSGDNEKLTCTFEEFFAP